jgi:hypothetical protein
MLHRYKQSLVEKGYLEIIPRHRPSGGRTSNFYDFSGLFAHLEQLLRRDRRDPASWQPTADEAEESEPAPAAAAPERAGPAPVPPSQHEYPPGVVGWPDVIAWGRQRALLGGEQPEATGAGPAALPAAAPPESPAPVAPTGPQESRLIPVEREEESGAAGAPNGPNRQASTRSRPDRRRNESPTAPPDAGPRQWQHQSRPQRPPAGPGTSKRSLQNDRGAPGAGAGPRPEVAGTAALAPAPVASDPAWPPRTPAAPAAPADPAAARWAAACAALARDLTPAAFNAWLRPLTPVALVAAGAAGGERLVLACASAFQRDHLLRRYRPAIEAAAGAACELVVPEPVVPEPVVPESAPPPAPAGPA